MSCNVQVSLYQWFALFMIVLATTVLAKTPKHFRSWMAYYYSNLWSSWCHNSEAFYSISIPRSCDICNNICIIWQSSQWQTWQRVQMRKISCLLIWVMSKGKNKRMKGYGERSSKKKSISLQRRKSVFWVQRKIGCLINWRVILFPHPQPYCLQKPCFKGCYLQCPKVNIRRGKKKREIINNDLDKE